MLDNIKSIYFIKTLFLFLDDGIELKLINYNKKLQSILDINLINYRRYAKTYIIYEDNKRGKEYNSYNDNLIFEGEYLNGKRNGKGKEYYDIGKLEFEGIYLNGEKNGKGKEYILNTNTLIFEGEYLNGKRNGKGK